MDEQEDLPKDMLEQVLHLVSCVQQSLPLLPLTQSVYMHMQVTVSSSKLIF